MEDPEARKQRLAALREKAAATTPAEDVGGSEPVLKLRNYIPLNPQKLEHERIAPAQPPVYEEPKAQPEAPKAAEDVLTDMAPKKANWDLKRDVQKKLDKLERRTMRALLELAQEEEKRRAEEEGEGEPEEEAA